MPGLADRVSNPLSTSFSKGLYSWDYLRGLLAEPFVFKQPYDIHLVRHGETSTNAQSLVTGSRDVPLTDLGREQARLVGHQLDRRYDVAFYSTLTRSQETLSLALAAGRVVVDPVIADWRLNERNLGELEMKPWEPIEELAKGDFSYAPIGGDSYAEVTRRLLSFLVDLVRYTREAEARKILVCGHMGPMRILMGIFEELSDPVAVLGQSFRNTEICRVKWRRLVFPAFLK